MPWRSPPFRSLVGSIALASAGLGLGCAGESAADRLTRACLEAMNAEEPLCRCIAEKAEVQLSAGSFDLLVAMLEEDEETANRLRGELDLSETMAAGMFMVRGPAECADALPSE